MNIEKWLQENYIFTKKIHTFINKEMNIYINKPLTLDMSIRAEVRSPQPARPYKSPGLGLVL